jgi:putative transposase
MGLKRHEDYKGENCFFVTTTCFNFNKFLASEQAKLELSQSINFLNNKYQADTLGYVIMPNHLHKIIYFKQQNFLSDWMRDLKKFTAFKIRQALECNNEAFLLNEARFIRKKQVFKIWNDRFHDVCLFTRRRLEIKLAYIHNNPMQPHWTLVKRPEDWLHSSANFYKTGRQPLVTVTDYRRYFPDSEFIDLRMLD